MKHWCVYVFFSWWIFLKTMIIINKKKVIVNHDVIVFDFNNIIIYINDSNIDDKIDFAIIWIITMNLSWILLILHIKKAYLKSTNDFMMYSNELYEIIMTLKMIKKNDINRSIHIFVNNQTTIYLFKRSQNKVDQYILKRIVKLYQNMKQKIILHRCSAHEKISENKFVDVTIKEFIKWRLKSMCSDSATFTSLNLIVFIFMIKFRVMTVAQKKWNYKWNICITKTITKNLIKKFHKRILIKYEGLRRAEVSIFIQFRTEKIVFQNYLHDIKTSDIKRCQCDDVENKMHVLLQCFKWASLRNKYFEIERDLRKLLNNNAFIKKIIAFILETKLLSQFRFVEASTYVFDEKDKENQPSSSAAMNFQK